MSKEEKSQDTKSGESKPQESKSEENVVVETARALIDIAAEVTGLEPIKESKKK